MEPHFEPVETMQIPSTLGDVSELVLAFVRSEPGAQQALLTRARQAPDEVTLALVTLGAVLLDISAGAFDLRPEVMLTKVAQGIAAMEQENAQQDG